MAATRFGLVSKLTAKSTRKLARPLGISLFVLFLGLRFAHSAPLAEGVGPRSGFGKIPAALELLERVPSGKRLLALALKTWNLGTAAELVSHQAIRTGAASRTDAVLTRRFNPLTGKETRERQITVYLRSDQSLDELVLDLAHELVHATTRPAWDPYDPTLTPGRYIQTAIEGPGGEVEAVLSECQVGRELIDITGATEAARTRCRDYWSAAGIERTAVQKDFYRVGRWKETLEKTLGEEMARFPLMDATSPRLYSSTGNAPYPIALLREFQEITDIACENTRRRLEARLSAADRTPASAPDSDSVAAPAASPDRFIARRCRLPADHLF